MNNTIPPPVWSIARILKQNKITRKKTIGYISKCKKYPYEYSLSQQIDFVGPRYLYSKARFYFLNVICCDTHFAQVQTVENQSSSNVCNGLIRFWKTAGIPDFLQMDNDLSFWGCLKKPNALGKTIRLCLLHKVTPVFIPSREPWRNGIIEHFNYKMQSAILSSGNFDNIEQIQQTADRFCEIHNHNHYYSSQKGMTPVQQQKYLNYPIATLEEDYELPKEPLPLYEGEIHIIRFIRSDHVFYLFGLGFVLPDKIQYEYVKGVLLTTENRLKIYRENELIKEYPFTFL